MDPDPAGACPGPTGNITQYQISFQTGSMVTKIVPIASCAAGRCNCSFEPPSNLPSTYDSVSVAAENVVGVGAARTCTNQTISELPTDMREPCLSSCVCQVTVDLKSLVYHFLCNYATAKIFKCASLLQIYLYWANSNN